MYLPSCTYRLQVNSSFPLKKIKELIPYLKGLGISTIYSAPFFAATPGSTHGYDGVDPSKINPEIGTLEEAREINALLKTHKMGWIQDIVPNHMAYDPHNVWLMDVFEKGPHSIYGTSFDIDWCHPDPELNAKVLSPFLGEPEKEIIHKGELVITHKMGRLYVNYHSLRYPLSWISFADVLKGIVWPEEGKDAFQFLIEHLEKIKTGLDKESFLSFIPQAEKMMETLFPEHSQASAHLDHHLSQLSLITEAFQRVLDQQYFFLSHYVKSDTVINFRRFFVVDQLICLRMDEPEVFEQYHGFTRQLLQEKLIDGLRIDHIDGLYNPKKYLERLRGLAGEETYLIVEKILDGEEEMPETWPIEGTSGYEFLSAANHLFTKKENKEKLDKIYQDFIGFSFDYDALVREKKCYMLEKRMGGERANLLALLLETELKDKSLDQEQLKDALFQWLVSFPVYRTYVDEETYSTCDQGIIRLSLQKARTLHPKLGHIWDLFENMFSEEGLRAPANRKFLLRLQQFTGPLAAKGVEDTTFYVYNRLISHNEVGDSPKSFGISTEEFHTRMKMRQKKLPFSLNTLSTHDTKRGEDARARINVLSEIPEEWANLVFQWRELNKKHKTMNGKEEMPVANDEYFIYQSLLGSFPMKGEVMTEDFLKRLKDFMLKALREAKVYTDHPNYNNEYEQATLRFVEQILHDSAFMDSFLPFFTRISDQAILISLGQTLLKNTAPGIPDTYQGTELWELSMVDPDNRRPIDFDLRATFLEEMQGAEDIPAMIKDMYANKRDGRLKFYLTWHSLQVRRKYPTVFHHGDYIPLTFQGEQAEGLVGYARCFEERWVLAVFPRKAIWEAKGSFPLGETTFKNTRLILPVGAPIKWENVLTHQEYEITGNFMQVSEVLQLFPVALLVNHSS